MKFTRFKNFIMHHLRAFRNTVTYRLEEFFTGKSISLFFCCPRNSITREQFICDVFEFFATLKSAVTSPFRSAFRNLSLKLKD